MSSHRTLFPQPDERQALEQLERLHREIQNARRQRERAGAEFDGFVASFEDPRADTTAPSRTAPFRRPRPSAIPRPLAPAPSERKVEPPPPPASVEHRQAPDAPPAPQPATEPPPVDVPFAQPHARSRRGAVLASIAVVIISLAVGILLWRQNTSSTSQDTPTTTRPSPPAVALPHEEIDSTPPTAPLASPPPALQVEISTVRSVWLRATVDGHRAVERQLPAGTRLVFTPSDSISVRAGDAGAVRVRVGTGPEEPLGRDGQVLTRAFVVSR